MRRVGVRVDRREDVGNLGNLGYGSCRPIGPALVEAWVDRNVSIIPPHISFEQARNLSSALVNGDPNELGVVLDSAKSVLAGMFLGRSGNGDAR